MSAVPDGDEQRYQRLSGLIQANGVAMGRSGFRALMLSQNQILSIIKVEMRSSDRRWQNCAEWDYLDPKSIKMC